MYLFGGYQGSRMAPRCSRRRVADGLTTDHPLRSGGSQDEVRHAWGEAGVPSRRVSRWAIWELMSQNYVLTCFISYPSTSLLQATLPCRVTSIRLECVHSREDPRSVRAFRATFHGRSPFESVWRRCTRRHRKGTTVERRSSVTTGEQHSCMRAIRDYSRSHTQFDLMVSRAGLSVSSRSVRWTWRPCARRQASCP